MSVKGTTGYCLLLELQGLQDSLGADGGVEGARLQCPAPYLGPLPPQEMSL